jgi:hypothetical protein
VDHKRVPTDAKLKLSLPPDPGPSSVDLATVKLQVGNPLPSPNQDEEISLATLSPKGLSLPELEDLQYKQAKKKSVSQLIAFRVPLAKFPLKKSVSQLIAFQVPLANPPLKKSVSQLIAFQVPLANPPTEEVISESIDRRAGTFDY